MSESKVVPTEQEVATWYAHGRARAVQKPAPDLEAEALRAFDRARADERVRAKMVDPISVNVAAQRYYEAVPHMVTQMTGKEDIVKGLRAALESLGIEVTS